MTAPAITKGGIPDQVQLPFDGTILVNKYDFMFYDTDDVKPVSSQADQGTEALNQAAIAPLFMGVALETRLLADTQAVAAFPVATDITGEWDCVSDTFEPGDTVTIDEDAGGTFLEDQKLVKTTDETLSIGRVMKRYGSATTRILVRIMSRKLPHSPAPDVTAQLSSATLPVIIFNGATGANEIRVPTNLADALSIESSAGDIVVLDTSTGAVVWNFSADVRVNVLGSFQGGNATTDLVAFHGSTPTDQCAAYTQTFATADRTHATPTVGADLGAFTDPPSAGEMSALRTFVNALKADHADLAQLANAVIDDLQEKGLVG